MSYIILGGGPHAIILAPTRELTEQVFGEIDKFLNPQRNQFILNNNNTNTNQSDILSSTKKKPVIYRVLGVVGGVSAATQIQPITQIGIDVIVATPGRLIDLLDKGIITMER